MAFMAKKKLDPIVKEVVAEMERQGLVSRPVAALKQRDQSGLAPILKSLIEEFERQQFAHKLSKYAVAKRAGIKASVVGRILNGERPDPQLSSVIAIAGALGCEVTLKKAEE